MKGLSLLIQKCKISKIGSNNRITGKSPSEDPMGSQKPDISNQTNDSSPPALASEDVWTVGGTVAPCSFHHEMFSLLSLSSSAYFHLFFNFLLGGLQGDGGMSVAGVHNVKLTRNQQEVEEKKRKAWKRSVEMIKQNSQWEGM